MRSPGLRERRKLQTREEIIDAAIDLFERQGYDETTVEDVAAAADVSPRTFFRYFDSKLDVVFAEKDHGDGMFEAMLAERPASEGPLEALHAVMRQALVQELCSEER